MKNKSIFYIFLYIILFVESLITIFTFVVYKDIKLNKISKDIYEIKFNNNKGATIFAETNKNGFVSLSFNDDSKNNGFISFSNEMNGYFYFYNAALDFAIDNRLSEKEGFLFQRLERYENNSGFYNIKYDNGIKIDELQLPSIESYE